ncbi:replication protein [Xenorhabdus sp. 18]|uniref:replication protein n=1 Tax=Xenorhabdus doucetiae TaxID=351671 RepID=UPI00198D5127|nr:replication protein [Xenorhabdus sp. 18]
MENQKLGFIPLYRSIKNKSWAKDVYLRTLWENLLIEAQKGSYTANYKGNVWHLKAGQLVTTPADLGLNLCDRNGKPTSRDAVNRMLAVFVREGMITIEGEKHKGTVITITNYSDYAEKMNDLPAHKSAHRGAHDEPSNDAASDDVPAHGGAHKAAHHEQEYILDTNVSNDRPGKKSEVLQRFLKRHPDAHVYTPSGKSWGTEDDLRAAQWIYALVTVVNPTAPEPNWPEWSNDIRLMRQQDNHAHREICSLFKWANKNHFWQTNILSPAKLREKWQTLILQKAQQEKQPQPTGHSGIDFNNTDWADGVTI